MFFFSCLKVLYACLLLVLCTSITCLKVCLSPGIMHFHPLHENMPVYWHYVLPSPA
jgi:hypothetical protein